ncbi:hypothetical protein BpHYR1_033440 [Brachionus plicatilis]|uniref:Uncharacterized protein n=1 Tax=Brachionus plicatilis TaxID=10195 RepID=A0A3M7RQG8_BRAPC|nr:hypothetical protein BpHYR1_033440 [Brachionus plicatilis]
MNWMSRRSDLMALDLSLLSYIPNFEANFVSYCLIIKSRHTVTTQLVYHGLGYWNFNKDILSCG